MNALLIGGTGNISLAVTKRLVNTGWDVTLINRGKSRAGVAGTEQLTANIDDPVAMKTLLKGRYFDAAAQFIAYTPRDVERDAALLGGVAAQYLFVSSASCYEKKGLNPVITERTPLDNPYWQYARDKIACERFVTGDQWPGGTAVTIVRPSHTYSSARLPVALHGGSPWQVVKRMLEHKPVIIPGDGTSLWTLTHADDFAVGFAGLMGNRSAYHRAVHITSDESLTWDAIYQTYADILGVKLRALHVPSDLLSRTAQYDFRGSLLGDKAQSVMFDNTLIKSLVPGFQARVPLREGLRRALDHHLNTPSLQKADPAFDAYCERVDHEMNRLGLLFEDMRAYGPCMS